MFSFTVEEMVVAISHGYATRLSRMDDAMEWLSAANLEDLFYPLLGYLTYEGDVVGFVTEPFDGEPLLSPDNLSLIYDMFQRLESNQLFVPFEISPWDMQVKDGKIRLIDGGLDCVFHWTKLLRSEKLVARKEHWATVDKLEDLIINYNRCGETRSMDKNDPDELCWLAAFTYDKTLRLVAYIPTPEHPLTDAWVRTIRSVQRSTMERHRRAIRSDSKVGIAGSTTSRIEELDSTSNGDEENPEKLAIRPVRLSVLYKPYRRGHSEQRRAICASSSKAPNDTIIGVGSPDFELDQNCDNENTVEQPSDFI
ncbi:hypothetical protein CYLTODRAFT_493571 [Cylindrobasidium torrendii FP15055 ss-10]|uniref:Uncharacterized protein n=1 Tax=Cylindrobasidium torrendii FP15055 ss-10 TaxID=1314674 RepID=A0A0D7AZT5_9AGAR|nr:hypothetical protein CYLTODRAFT_493571 [Cylindrobasidium torrendii FP15055 ss-10]